MLLQSGLLPEERYNCPVLKGTHLMHVFKSVSFQELVWKRSASANVRMYELTIKKDEEKALSYEVEDIEDDVYCRGEVTLTLPSDFAFEEGSKYKINVYR